MKVWREHDRRLCCENEGDKMRLLVSRCRDMTYLTWNGLQRGRAVASRNVKNGAGMTFDQCTPEVEVIILLAYLDCCFQTRSLAIARFDLIHFRGRLMATCVLADRCLPFEGAHICRLDLINKSIHLRRNERQALIKTWSES